MKDYLKLSTPEHLKFLSDIQVSDLEKTISLIVRNSHNKLFVKAISKVVLEEYLTVKEIALKMTELTEVTYSSQSVNKLLTQLKYQTRVRNKNSQFDYTLTTRAIELGLGKPHRTGTKHSIRWHSSIVDNILQNIDISLD